MEIPLSPFQTDGDDDRRQTAMCECLRRKIVKQGTKSGGRERREESLCVFLPLRFEPESALLYLSPSRHLFFPFKLYSESTLYFRPALNFLRLYISFSLARMGWVAISWQLFPLRECVCGTNCTWTLTTIFLAFFLPFHVTFQKRNHEDSFHYNVTPLTHLLYNRTFFNRSFHS